MPLQPKFNAMVLKRLVQSSLSSQQPCNSRFLSAHSSQRQQAAQTPRSPPSQAPPPPPTSLPPSPNNSTPPTSPDPTSPSSTTVSTAQMQKHITSNLPSSRPSLTNKLAKTLRSTLPSTASTYMTYGLTELLFNSCSAHTSYTIPESQRTQILTDQGPPKTASGEDIGQPDPPLPTSKTSNSPTRTFFFTDLGLLPTFSTWSQTTFLHMYLLTVYLRSLPQPNSPSSIPKSSIPGTKTTMTATSFQTYQQYLLEHFSQLAETHMMTYHTISARGIRNRYLKDLFIQWRGILAAYDQGLVEGDAVLASAVWRNMFKGDEDVDWAKVAMVVCYMRKAIVELEKVNDVQDLPRRLDGKGGVWARSLEGVRDMVVREGRELRSSVDQV